MKFQKIFEKIIQRLENFAFTLFLNLLFIIVSEDSSSRMTIFFSKKKKKKKKPICWTKFDAE